MAQNVTTYDAINFVSEESNLGPLDSGCNLLKIKPAHWINYLTNVKQSQSVK